MGGHRTLRAELEAGASREAASSLAAQDDAQKAAAALADAETRAAKLDAIRAEQVQHPTPDTLHVIYIYI